MPAPESYPNLSRAGEGRPVKKNRVRITTQVSQEAKQFLIELGGGPKSIGKAIEQVVEFWKEEKTMNVLSYEDVKIKEATEVISDGVWLPNLELNASESEINTKTKRRQEFISWGKTLKEYGCTIKIAKYDFSHVTVEVWRNDVLLSYAHENNYGGGANIEIDVRTRAVYKAVEAIQKEADN